MVGARLLRPARRVRAWASDALVSNTFTATVGPRGMEGMMDWKPIDTAPTEASVRFLVYFPEDNDVGWGDCICEAWRSPSGVIVFAVDSEFRSDDGITPTYWASRKLPEDKPR